MAKFIDDIVNRTVTVLNNQVHRGPQFVAKIGRNANSNPVEFGIAIMESFAFGFRQGCIGGNSVPTFDQEFVPFHLTEFDLRIEPNRVPVPGIDELFRIVPAEGLESRYENSLPEVLTFGNSKLQWCNPLLIAQVWPLVTIDTVDASLRCSSIAWLYSPDLGTFPAESPSLSGCIRQLCFAREKSLRIEVEDGHRS